MAHIRSLTTRLRLILDQAIAQSIASSISLSIDFGIGDGAHNIVLHAGQTHAHPERTIYDLASLTKIIGTTVAIAQAIADKNMSLDECPFPVWPHASVAALLAHKAGLPAHRHLYEEFALSGNDFSRNREAIFERLFATPAGQTTHQRVYSDLGFIALGWLLEQRLKKSLWEIFTDAWTRLNIKHDFYWMPSKPITFTSENPAIVPTGYCQARMHLVAAQVHDPNCYFMGGLAGHAGLFGSLSAVAELGRFFLRAYKNPQNASEQIIAQFARRGFGFDQPTIKGTTRYFSPFAFGHFGYTGTSLWIDPAWARGPGLTVSLLTNRVHRNEKPEGIFWLRLAINQAIARHALSPNTA